MRTDLTWWSAVQSIATMFRSQSDGAELSEPVIKQTLQSLAFDESDIQRAIDWVEQASLSGHLIESLAMLGPVSSSIRLHSQLETVHLPQRVRNRIELCRLKGFLSQEVVERLLEGLRALDAREMDEDELVALLAELLAIVVPTTPKKEFLRILTDDLRELYS